MRLQPPNEAIGGSRLLVVLSGPMQWRLGRRDRSFEPVSEPVVKLCGWFFVQSSAFAEGFRPTTKLGETARSFFESFSLREKLPKPLLCEFLDARSVVRAAMMQRDFVDFAIRLATAVHLAFLFVSVGQLG